MKVSVCPSCGSPRIRRVKRNWTDRFQGKAYTVRGLEFYECPVCGEKVYDREAMRRIEARCPAFAKSHVGK